MRVKMMKKNIIFKNYIRELNVIRTESDFYTVYYYYNLSLYIYLYILK